MGGGDHGWQPVFIDSHTKEDNEERFATVNGYTQKMPGYATAYTIDMLVFIVHHQTILSTCAQ